MTDKDVQNLPHIGKKLRAVRQQQGLSLRDLAAKAQVSPSMLSKIENGKATPSVRSLHSIAEALSLSITHFFPSEDPEEQSEADPAETSETEAPHASTIEAVSPLSQAYEEFSVAADQPQGPVIRGHTRPTIELLDGIVWSRLTPGPEEGVEFMEIRYEVGASSGQQMSHHSGREVQLVLEGELLIELGIERHLLKAGDSITYDSTIPHRLVNVGQGPMRAISLLFNTK